MSKSSSTRGRRWRSGLAVAAAAALTISMAGIAMADDVQLDNDVVASGLQHSVDLTVAPGDPVSETAQFVVDFQGSKHLTGGSAIVVGLDSSSTDFDGVTGVTVGNATGTVPASWTSSSSDFTLSSTVSFNAPTTPGTYNLVIHYAATSYTCLAGDDKCLSGTGNPFNINLTVQAPTSTNHAPSVTFTNPPTTANEGDVKTFNFSISDADAADTHTYAAGYPNCGAGNAVVGTPSIDQTAHTGTFDCRFVDGLVPAVDNTVSVRVTDSASATSAEASTLVTVSNLAPEVAQPSLSATAIDCNSGVTLSPISFSDAGVVDFPWAVDINWGDGNHTTYNTSTQGAQSNATHTYTTGGTFTPTVTVTDKDGEHDTATSSNSVVVNQYAVDFLPPFDDSNPSGLIVNTMKNGRTVPVKSTIKDLCANAYVTSPSVVTIKVSKTTLESTAAPDPLESYADAGASSDNTNLFRWNPDSTSPTGGFWIYNLDSKALGLTTNITYRIDICVDGKKATVTDWAILKPVK